MKKDGKKIDSESGERGRESTRTNGQACVTLPHNSKALAGGSHAPRGVDHGFRYDIAV